MEPFTHEFTDSLASFLKDFPDGNLNGWLSSLKYEKLSRLQEQLIGVEQGTDIFVFVFDQEQALNEVADIFFLAFKVHNIGKKRKVLSMDPEKRLKLTSQILADVRLMLILRKADR